MTGWHIRYCNRLGRYYTVIVPFAPLNKNILVRRTICSPPLVAEQDPDRMNTNTSTTNTNTNTTKHQTQNL